MHAPLQWFGRPACRLFLSLACLFTAFSGAQAETLYFSPLPMEQPEEVVKQFKPMLNFLEKQLGAKIEIRYSTSYAEILEHFRTGRIDLAYLGPLPYISLRESHPKAEPLVHFLEKNGEATYSCALISAGAPLPRPARKKTFALTQPLSTCGYLAIDAQLRKQGDRLDSNSSATLASTTKWPWPLPGAITSTAVPKPQLPGTMPIWASPFWPRRRRCRLSPWLPAAGACPPNASHSYARC